MLRPSLAQITLTPPTTLSTQHSALSTSPDLPPTQPAKTPEEIQARYDAVLSVIKSPPNPGVLVAELLPASAAARAGLTPADIITEYNQLPIHSEDDLRQAVAEAAALRNVVDDIPDSVPLTLRRNNSTLHVKILRGPLGILPLTVETGIPLPLNPPPTPRGTFSLDWSTLPDQDSDLHLSTPQDNTPKLSAIEHTTFHQAHNKSQLTLTKWTLAATAPLSTQNSELSTSSRAAKILARHEASLLFLPGDNLTLPPYETDILTFQTTDSLGTESLSVERKALTLHIDRTFNESKPESYLRPTLPGAIPNFALPTLAAALPHKEDLTLAIPVISEADWQTRLGYCLHTLGKKPLPTTIAKDAPKEAWTVQLLHFARPESTYYFADDHTLLHAQLGAETAHPTPAQSAWQGLTIK